MLNIITAPQKKFTLSVELKGGGWLVDLVSLLQILSSSLVKLSLSSENHLVEIVDLSESSGLGASQRSPHGESSELVLIKQSSETECLLSQHI